MPEHYRPPVLPETDDYADAARHIDLMLTSTPAASEKILRQQMIMTDSHKTFSEMATRVGVCIEPRSESTLEPIDPSCKITRAFLLGSVTGLLLSKELHGPLLRPSSIFNDVPRL